MKASNKVLVVGGGVGGIKTALDLAEAERDVVLIDKAASIGGLMTQLDRTFPTNNCDMCTISPHLAESGRELHIDLSPLTQVTTVEGEAGKFKVTLTSQPRYIDVEKCTACGECHRQFPQFVNFTPGLDHRAPTCMRYPQATPLAFSIDMAKCDDVDALVKVCPDQAIIPDDSEQVKEIEVGSIVLAPGAQLYNPDSLVYYGHGHHPNVVTGLEYERIMSASGPTGGRLVCPTDDQQPKKVAWIQCVGSRNLQPGDASYCSSVCCMYALKEAIVTKERFQDDIETVIFYMDMRTFGKGYEEYLERAKNEYNVRLVRCRPHTVDPVNENGSLSIAYVPDDSSGLQREEFDMVVLSTGFRIPPDLVELGQKMGIELNRHHFAASDPFNPVATSREGIYVCGVYQSPKDVPETLIQASACAGAADLHLPPVETLEIEEDFPPERDIVDEPPKIGVFVCDCGANIGGVIKADDVADYAAGLPDVYHSEMVGHGCSREAMDHMEEVIRRKGLNRLVVGGCSPRTHETKFQDTARRAGLNKYLVEMANIRDQDTWVHLDHPAEASEKAKDLIRMAASSAAMRRPLTDQTLPVNKSVLVVGGGVAGMSAALNMAESGFRVFLVEREATLGGLASKVRKTLEKADVQPFVENLVQRCVAHPKIQVLTGTLIVDHSGIPGLYKTGIQSGPRMAYRQLTHGAAIIATGSTANRPDEYLLGRHNAVVTQMDLDNLLEDDPDRFKTLEQIVMIQCVGSREPGNPNCSRVCCQAAIKNALRVLEINPSAQIFVLNRDMRTYGFQEDYFREAREKGVIFVRYGLDRKPEVTADGDQITVSFHDPILGRDITVNPGLLALSTGFLADDENTEDLGAIFRLPRTTDSYFLEEHVKLMPVDLPSPGFTVAGTAHAPKGIGESVAQGLAAAGRTKAMLAKDEINLGAVIAKVEASKCAACLICVRACPFEVPFINADGYSEIDPAKCQGCGICAAACPAKAIQLMQFEDDMILAKLFGLLEGVM